MVMTVDPNEKQHVTNSFLVCGLLLITVNFATMPAGVSAQITTQENKVVLEIVINFNLLVIYGFFFIHIYFFVRVSFSFLNLIN